MAKILALDYGTKRIGVAVSDETLTFAFPRETILNHSYQSVLQKLTLICKEEKINKLVIGLPKFLDGENSSQTDQTIRFAKKLEQDLETPLYYVDERLTSIQNQKLKRQVNPKHKKNIQTKDAEEACLILSAYLQQKKRI